jgi:hypothetical protein
MSNDCESSDGWPQFELVTFPEPTNIPREWTRELVEKGAPKELFGHYSAAAALSVLEVPDYGRLVCFGTCGIECSVCQDPNTRAVICGVIGLPGERPWVVNSSLDLFIATVRAVLNRFPYDPAQKEDIDTGALENRWDPIADELTGLIRDIDASAVADPNGFWMGFVDDVRMGDLSVEEVLGRRDG